MRRERIACGERLRYPKGVLIPNLLMAKRKIGLLATGLVVALLGLVAVVETQRQGVQAEPLQLTGQIRNLGSSEEEVVDDKERADQIVAELKELMDIDTSVDPTVATIIDIEILRSQNSFYDKAENGDHLVVTPTRAILYSSSKNIILDVVPITLEPAPAADSEAEAVVEEGSVEE